MNVNVISYAEIWSGGDHLDTIQLEDGSGIVIDRGNTYRRTGSMVFSDPTGTLAPTSSGSPLAPFGNEIRPYYGVAYDDGELEPVLEGTYQIEEPDVDDSVADNAFALNVTDRMSAVSRAGFIDTFSIDPFTNIGDACFAMLQSLPLPFDLVTNFFPTDFTTGSTSTVFGPADDPAQALVTLAAGAACEIYPDPYGVFCFLPAPNPLTVDPIWDYVEGPGNLGVRFKRALTRGKAPNYIIRDGQGTGVAAPVRGVSFDNNPLSATYIGGKYGRQRDYATSPLWVTQAQAQAASDAALLTRLGSVETVEVTAFVMPGHDVDDVINVKRERIGIPGTLRYVLDTINMGFTKTGTNVLSTRAIAGFPTP